MYDHKGWSNDVLRQSTCKLLASLKQITTCMIEITSYLWIKQPVCVPDVILIAIQTIVGSWRKMHVYVRYAGFDKYNKEAAPNNSGPPVIIEKYRCFKIRTVRLEFWSVNTKLKLKTEWKLVI